MMLGWGVEIVLGTVCRNFLARIHAFSIFMSETSETYETSETFETYDTYEKKETMDTPELSVA